MGTDLKSLSVIILTDNKIGHFNQSWAVAQLLSPSQIISIPIQYKSKIHQLVLSLLTYLPLPRFLIPFLLTQSLKNSYQQIISPCGQMVISTGSSLNAPNLFLSRLKSAKSVVIMKPAWGWKRHYDLQIIPKHDTSSFFDGLSNTVLTLGAPTSICEKKLKEHAQKLSTTLSLPPQKYISLFIGGPSSHHHLTVEILQELVQKLKKILQEKNMHLLITTSRRTPQDVSRYLKDTFSTHPRCPLLVIAKDSPSQPENLISGMMGLSELILVTEDSISMISEAASSGKKVIVVQTDLNPNKSKHRRFIQELAQEKYIDLAPLPLLDKIIIQKLESTIPHKVLNNNGPIQKALLGLFKKTQVRGARGGTTEAYLSGTSKEGQRGQRSRWDFFNSPLKIIQILPQLKEGGAERGTLDLCFYLQKQGHCVWVISHGGPLVQKLQEKGIRHLCWPVHKKNPLTIFRMSQRLRKLIQNEKIEIVHARSRVPAWITYLACQKTKWVTTCHGYYRTHFGSRVMSWADKIIVATHIIQAHMTQDFGAPKEKIALIPRGVDLDTFTFTPPSPQSIPVLGVIGRLTPIKGHKDFLEALALLKKQNKLFKAQIIGEAKDPSYLKELLDLTQKLGLSKEVQFLGHQEDIPAILKQMNLLILPTTYPEAFGRVIIEAQAVGIPVVATRIGGIQEVIDDGQTGLLCDPQNPSDLAHAMIKILDNPHFAQTLVQKARKKVELCYSKEQMVQKTEHLYLEMTRPHILVVKLTSLGDVILISASLRALKQKFPNSRMTLLTDPSCQEVVESCPYIDKIIYVSKKNLRSSFWKLILQIKNQKFDTSIDFQNTFWTHLLSFWAHIPNRYGYGRKAGWLFLNHVAPHIPLSAVDHQFEILKLLGMSPQKNSKDSKLEFWIREEDRTSLFQKVQGEQLDLQKPFAIIHLGASWATKRWTASHIAQFCEHLFQKEHLSIVFTGLEKDLEFEREIRHYIKVPFVSLVGKTTLRQLGALIEKCKSFISPDSAPLHIAAALGKPTLALFGPTEAQKHRPPNDKLLILQEKVDCGPCYKSTCSHHSCMVRLTPSRAIEAYEKLQRL